MINDLDTVHTVHTATAEVALNVLRCWCPLLPDTPPMSLVEHVVYTVATVLDHNYISGESLPESHKVL